MKRLGIVISFMLALCISTSGCGNFSAETVQTEENDTISKETQIIQTEENEQSEMTIDGFNFETKSVQLSNGSTMPILGFGTWTLTDAEAEECVYAAIKDGYRLFDTARYYGTEAGIGRAVRRAIEEGIVTRDEIFITTKIVPYGFDDYYNVIEESNANIGLDYIDLVLIHQQGTDDVSQFGIIVESYYPFGGRGHTSDSFGNEVITEIAQNHDVTTAQVILRWHLQEGYIAIPGSSNPEHIAENFNVFDFELSDEEMNEIRELDTGERYETW